MKITIDPKNPSTIFDALSAMATNQAVSAANSHEVDVDLALVSIRTAITTLEELEPGIDFSGLRWALESAETELFKGK